MAPKKTISKKAPAKKAPAKAPAAKAASASAGGSDVTIEALQELRRIQDAAAKVDALVKAAVPGACVTINAEKPRKGCFEVKANGTTVVSLTDMPRPFTKLKALDMDEVAADVVKALK
eukprot:CAMPEP_0185474512 /NCGR_PEP_ID=MMETSP1366-20130426/2060_1 /TAXON_ID=38817 /ORGANISM="Gephyrocapsa oceanica, Strain RCC1303" /LENGTH=117 /DNA_ID=CAMNT_0028081403 /DNA_START=83 /DNA_END=436 /DNA_ORIENTATION=+